MNLVVSAGFGLALALSSLAFSGTPTSALPVPAVAVVSQDGLTKVSDYWDDRLASLKRRQRCERAHYKCAKRFSGDRHMVRECVARYRCGR
jgi:hypothetical protein